MVVEWSRFAEEAGVNLWEIVNAIRVRKTHANLMFPNIGVGGYCSHKDLLLASWARKSFFGLDDELSMSVDSVSTNDQMPAFAYKRLHTVFGDLKRKKELHSSAYPIEAMLEIQDSLLYEVCMNLFL